VDGQQIGNKALDYIHLAQDRDKWRAFVDAVMNLRVPSNVEHCLAAA